ncbi:NERD domain-containing protein [Candidatus Parcubacteria bacterium]|nr:MAG: NERD domain-containing protein [Candidatus Parcubacteria bacterium]
MGECRQQPGEGLANPDTSLDMNEESGRQGGPDLRYLKENRLMKEALEEGERAKAEAIVAASTARRRMVGALKLGGACLVVWLMNGAEVNALSIGLFAFFALATFFFAVDSIGPSVNEVWVNPVKVAGAEGEDKVVERISGLSMEQPCYLFNQLSVPHPYDQGKRVEIDLVLLSPEGMILVEVKNIRGYIVGDESDKCLQRYKESSSGNIYLEEIPNPVRQLGFQIFSMKKYLSDQGINVWIDGVVIFSNENCKLDLERRERIFHIEELSSSLLKGRRRISKARLRSIEGVLSKI